MNNVPAPVADKARAELSAALSEVARGNRRAFAMIYDRTSAKLFGVCLRILGSRSEAEDVLQETFVNVWRNAAGYDAGRASPISWLAAIARNKAIDRLRSRGKRMFTTIDEEVQAIPDPSPSALTLVSDGQERAQLMGCIGELDAQHGEAIRAAFFGGLTYAELADKEAVPLGTMKSWIRRGLMRLKDCLER